jgi:trigger factor
MAELIKHHGNTVEFKVVVPRKEVKAAFEGVFSNLARQVRLPGFRPGKAPRSVLVKRVGQETIDSEVRNTLINASLVSAIQDLKLNILTDSLAIELSELSDNAEFSYVAKGEVYPAVTLGDWTAITLEAKAPEITEEVVSKTLSDLRERNAIFDSVERAAEAGDQLTIQEISEEGANPYPVYLDSAEAFVREALVGKTAGEEISITTPAVQHEDHSHESEVIVVKILDIKKKTLPDLDDEFAKTLNFDTVELLHKAVERELKTRAFNEGNAARREEFIERLVGIMGVELPATLIAHRREVMFEEIKGDLERQGVPFSEYETFMKEQDKYEEFMADLEKNAVQRVKRDLALEKLSEVLGVTLSNSELDAALNQQAVASRTTVAEVRRQLGETGLSGFQVSLAREKALNHALLIVNAGAGISLEAPALAPVAVVETEVVAEEVVAEEVVAETPVEEVVAEEVVAETPVEEVVAEEVVAETAVEEVVAETRVEEVVAAETPVEEVVAEEVVAEEVVAEEVVAEEVVAETAVEEVVAEIPVEEVVAEEVVAETAVEEVVAEEVVAEEVVAETPVEEVVAEEVVAETAVEEVVAAETPVEEVVASETPLEPEATE